VEEEQQRQQRQLEGGGGGGPVDGSQTPNNSGQYGNVPPRQLPPLAYQQPPVQPGMHHYAPGQGNIDPLQQYPNTATMYANYPQTSAYPQTQSQPMYQPRQAPLHSGNEETDADAEPDPDVPATSFNHN